MVSHKGEYTFFDDLVKKDQVNFFPVFLEAQNLKNIIPYTPIHIGLKYSYPAFYTTCLEMHISPGIIEQARYI